MANQRQGQCWQQTGRKPTNIAKQEKYKIGATHLLIYITEGWIHYGGYQRQGGRVPKGSKSSLQKLTITPKRTEQTPCKTFAMVGSKTAALTTGSWISRISIMAPKPSKGRSKEGKKANNQPRRCKPKRISRQHYRGIKGNGQEGSQKRTQAKSNKRTKQKKAQKVLLEDKVKRNKRQKADTANKN